jgi:glycosyltransferase involved in cell wall biosynthesis
MKTIDIIRKANSDNKKILNILTFDTHERYQEQLAKTGHNFYSFRYDNCKLWNTTYAKIPSNYYVMPKGTIISGLEYDLILSQSKFGQYQVAQQLKRFFDVPIISLEHTLPIPSWPNQQLEAFRQMSGDINIFISEYSRRQWQMNGEVIHHSVDMETFKPAINEAVNLPKENHVLSVVNDYVNRDYCCNFSGWQRITSGIKTKLVGDTPGLSKAVASTADLVKEYQQAAVFLNTSTISPVPTALLEAMACGCAVVSTATCMIPEIIENGINGFISNDEEELKEYIQVLLVSEELQKRIGNAARETILKRFSQEQFINKWNEIFNKAVRV